MGRLVFVKRTAEYVLTAGDILTVDTTPVNADVININITNMPPSISGTGQAGFVIVSGAPEYSRLTTYEPSSSGFGHYSGATALRLTTPVGHFANLAAAQAALTGVKIVYQLATPIIIEEKDFPAYGITVNGSLTSNTDFTEYFVDGYDILAPVTITYPTNLSKAVSSLKDSSQSIRNVLSTPTSLIPITTGFLTNWSGTIRYGKSREGFVSVYIDLLRSADILSTAEILYTLPLGFRPTGVITSTVNLLSSTDVSVASSYANISINTSGQITILPVTSTTLTNARSIMLTFNYYSA